MKQSQKSLTGVFNDREFINARIRQVEAGTSLNTEKNGTL